MTAATGYRHPKTIVIIPAYNEADSLNSTISEIRDAAPSADILVVNDGSTDQTAGVASRQAVRLVSHAVNLGIGAAVQTGFKYAIMHRYDLAVQVDGDGQHNPAYLGLLMSKFLEHDADIVIGSRYCNSSGNSNWKNSLVRSAGISLFSKLTSACTGQRVTDCSSGFRFVGSRTLALFSQDYPTDFPDAEALILAGRKGMKIVEVPVIFRRRQSGTSKLSFFRMIYYPLKEGFSILMLLLRGD